MKNHKSSLKILVFFVFILVIGVSIAFLNMNNLSNKLNENVENNNVLKNNTSVSSNLQNLPESKEPVLRYQEIIKKGYCGDNICDSNNNENKETCCEDCGCKANFTCRYGVCILLNYSPNHSFYSDNKLNFSVEIPNRWIISKHENGILFRGDESTNAWFNVISINVFPSIYNGQTIHEAGIDMTYTRKTKEIHFENATLRRLSAEKIVSIHPYENSELKKINIITKKEDYFYSLSYTSLIEYFNLSIDEFNHSADTFKFIDGNGQFFKI